MSIYKRGGIWWYSFMFRGERVQESSGQRNIKEARQAETKRKSLLVRERAEYEKRADEIGCQLNDLVRCTGCGVLSNRLAVVLTGQGKFCGKSCRDRWEKDHVAIPTLQEFKGRFMDSVKTRSGDRPSTVDFYQFKYARLLDFTPLAGTRLDLIDEGLIESYVQHRSKIVSLSTVNRELATLRKALRLAMKWRVVDRVPSFSLFSEDGRERTFVLGQPQEQIYLEFAPQPLRDLALLMVDTGLRVGEACGLEWGSIHLEPASGAKFGYLHIVRGKTRSAKRNVPLTIRVRAMLESRLESRKSGWVFPAGDCSLPVTRFTVRTQHQVLRKRLKLPADFVIHSLRHTALTRLGEAGTGVVDIMRVAGHSSILVSQKYMHPSPECIERAFERLDAMNTQARAALPNISQNRSLLPTVIATVEGGQIDAAREVV